MPEIKLGNVSVIFSNFQNQACCEKYLKDNRYNSLRLKRKYARIFIRPRKTVCFSEQIMSADKFPRIFSPQMEVAVYVNLR